LMIVGRAGVWPDSVQVPGGRLSSRLPTSVTGVALFRFAARRAPLPVRGSRGDCPALSSNARPASTDNDDGRAKLMAKVFIGVDPHKLSATIEVVDGHETVLATGRFGTDKAGYAAMRRQVAAYPDRVWAVEGSNGTGRPLAQRLLADGEHVVDVPAKLSARARLLDTGHNRKTDAHDAHAVAVVAAAPSRCGCCPMTPSSKCSGCWSSAATS